MVKLHQGKVNQPATNTCHETRKIATEKQPFKIMIIKHLIICIWN